MLSETAAAAFCPELFSLPRNGSEQNSESLLLFLLHGTEFRAVFSSTERFGREFREFALPQNDSERNSESLLLFLLHGTEFRVVFLPLKGSEWNSEGSLLFLVYGTEFRVVFSSAEGFGTEFREFLFRGTVGIPSEITICSVNSVFRGIIFLSEIPNPTFKRYISIWMTNKIGVLLARNLLVFLNFKGAQESISRNRFRQPM